MTALNDRPTKFSTRRKLGRLHRAEHALRMDIFKLVERTDVPFSVCLERASDDQREMLRALQSDQIATEAYAIERGWAYRSTFGGISWHR